MKFCIFISSFFTGWSCGNMSYQWGQASKDLYNNYDNFAEQFKSHTIFLFLFVDCDIHSQVSFVYWWSIKFGDFPHKKKQGSHAWLVCVVLVSSWCVLWLFCVFCCLLVLLLPITASLAFNVSHAIPRGEILPPLSGWGCAPGTKKPIFQRKIPENHTLFQS